MAAAWQAKEKRSEIKHQQHQQYHGAYGSSSMALSKWRKGRAANTFMTAARDSRLLFDLPYSKHCTAGTMFIFAQNISPHLSFKSITSDWRE